MCVIMEMERENRIAGTKPPAVQNNCDTGGLLDETVYQDEYVQLAIFSLVKNLCADMETKEDCITPDTPSTPSTPTDVSGAVQCKLEQAADTMKNHLLHTVRKEVDALRGKVSALERKIYRLEVENTVLLQEYVPPEIYARLRADQKRRRSSACARIQKQQQKPLTSGPDKSTIIGSF